MPNSVYLFDWCADSVWILQQRLRSRSKCALGYCARRLNAQSLRNPVPHIKSNTRAEGSNMEEGGGEFRNGDAVQAGRRKYVVPSISRYGTLTDLTKNNGNKNHNDGQPNAPGCGKNNFMLSCV